MITASSLETRAVGESLASLLRAGDVLLLQGDLGAGKSELTRGLARGLGVDGPVPSPSFTILNVYEEGRAPLYHFDWYRLRGADELFEMGMEEYLGGDGIAVVEWPERCPEAVPEDCLVLHMDWLGPDRRRIAFEARGRMAERAEALSRLLPETDGETDKDEASAD